MGDVFFGSNTSWANMIVTASWRAYVIRQSHSGLSYPSTRERGNHNTIYSQVHSKYKQSNKYTQIYKWK